MATISITVSDAQKKAIELDGMDRDPVVSIEDAVQNQVQSWANGLINSRVQNIVNGSDPESMNDEEREAILLDKYPVA